MSKQVILIGDINIDLSLKGIKNISEIKLGAELGINEYTFDIGGSGFNFIKAMNSFGVKTDFYGKIGNDFFGHNIQEYLCKNKITNSLIIKDEIKTGITTMIPIKKNRFFFTYSGGNECLNINDLDFGKISQFDHVHLSSYYLLKGLQQDYITILKKIRENKNITISFDNGFDPLRNWQSEKIFEILKYVDIFLPNEVEALNITKTKNIEKALDILSAQCEIVIIKLGPSGLIARDNRNNGSETMGLLPYDVKVADTSCCGDCFDAGFIYGFLNNYGFQNSLDLANGCGSLQASKLGSYKFEDLREITDFMKVTKKVMGQRKGELYG
jgi:sugar/nucleoside kinase (ribokinase family)